MHAARDAAPPAPTWRFRLTPSANVFRAMHWSWITVAAFLARRSPGAALRVSDLVARIGAPFRRHSPAEVQRLLPQLSRREALRVLRLALQHRMRDDLVDEIWSSPRLRPYIHVAPAITAMPGPVIFATFHIGPLAAVKHFHVACRPDALFLLAHAQQKGAAVLYRAARHLAAGGTVIAAIDALQTSASRIAAPLFGGTVPLARGVFALSRMTGAPIVPLVFAWRGREVHAVRGEPIDPADPSFRRDEPAAWEARLAAATAGWLEQHVRANTDDLALRIIKNFGHD